MTRRRKKSGPMVVLLFAGLAFWVFERGARQYAETARPLREAYLPRQDPSLPDTTLPNPTADNGMMAGMAPGFSPMAGEKEDLITVLDASDRIMVTGRGVARQPPPLAVDSDPLFYPAPKLFVSSGSYVTPLDVRDPSALVMPPAEK